MLECPAYTTLRTAYSDLPFPSGQATETDLRRLLNNCKGEGFTFSYRSPRAPVSRYSNSCRNLIVQTGDQMEDQIQSLLTYTYAL